jgi:hypothetical protein
MFFAAIRDCAAESSLQECMFPAHQRHEQRDGVMRTIVLLHGCCIGVAYQ